MKKLYILSHQFGFRAFEDYCENLKLSIARLFDVRIVVYNEESEIPLPLTHGEIYLFMSYIPPKFINLHLTRKHKNIHVINTEQSTRPIWSLIIKHYTKIGINICDYDQYQTDLTQKMLSNKKIYYLPYQITKPETDYLMSLIKKNNKIYDVAFCSTNQSKKRVNLYTHLEKRGLNVVDITGWKDRRDNEISKAKVLVNIHFDDDYQIFEHMRCDRWILSGMLVISEESLSDTLLDCHDLMIIEKYDNMIDKIIEIVANYEEYYSAYLAKLLVQRKKIIKNRQKHCNHVFTSLSDEDVDSH